MIISSTTYDNITSFKQLREVIKYKQKEEIIKLQTSNRLLSQSNYHLTEFLTKMEIYNGKKYN